MADIKIVTFFTQTAGEHDRGRIAGWSETWYFSGSIAEAYDAIGRVEKKRAAFLTNHAAIVGYRIGIIKGASQIFTADTPGAYSTPQDIPMSSLNCVVAANSIPNVKRFQLRGLADVQSKFGEWSKDGIVPGLVAQYGASLAAQQIRFRALDQSTPRVAIRSIAPDGTFTCDAGLTFLEGANLTVLRCRNTAGKSANGTFKVVTKTSDQAGRFGNWNGGTVNVSGQMRAVAILYPTVKPGSFAVLGVTTRKVGRPFGLYLGRRRKR